MRAFFPVLPLNKLLSLACILAAFIVMSGCAARDSGPGMTMPKVCANLCKLGQTQAAYPDCSCSGGTSGGGLGQVGVCGNLCGIGQSRAQYPDCSCSGGTSGGGLGGVHSGGGVAAGALSPSYYEWEYVNDYLYGAPASARDAQGMLLVSAAASDSAGRAIHGINATVGPVSTYLEGPGGGWVYASVRNTTVMLSALGNSSMPVGLNRVWTGKYARITFEVANLSGADEYGDPVAIFLPQGKYAVVAMIPVSPGATSAVQLVFDLADSFTAAANGSFAFTPVIEVRSFSGVNYLVTDGGAVQLSSGTLLLSETVRFNERGESGYTVLGGTGSSCVRNCTLDCAQPAAPACNTACASACMADVGSDRARFCSDGTPFGECARVKPFLCRVGGGYLADCSGCGCPQNQSCNRDGTCSMIELD